MSIDDGRGSRRPRRSRVLWWVFGAVASLGATMTVVLWWLLRRDRAATVAPLPPDHPPLTAPPEVGPDDPGSDFSCDTSCVDSCSSSASEACDDLVDDVCGSVDDCGSSTTCDSPSCDGPTCDPDISCNSTAAGSQLVQLLTGTVWLATPARLDRVTLPARLGVAAIRAYQRFLSPRLGTRCRYSPSCSEYGVAALVQYGALEGAMRTVTRIRRCTVTVPHGTLDPA